MLTKLKQHFSGSLLKNIFDVRNIGLYVFAVIVLAVSWSTVGAIQVNFRLQQRIAKLSDELAVQDLTNKTQALKNEYLKSDQYLELAARRDFGKAAEGEKVINVPRATALLHAAKLPKQDNKAQEVVYDDRATYIKNIQAWFDFFNSRR